MSALVWPPGILCDEDKRKLVKGDAISHENHFLVYLRTENADIRQILTDLAIYDHQ